MNTPCIDKTAPKSEYAVRRCGRPFTKDYRIYFERARDKIPVSPIHDIPLYHDKKKGVLNMVVEIPRWTNAKYEISRKRSLNPILQNELDKKERFVKNCFPYKGYIWNYGAFPQTWEDPHHRHPDTDAPGDNDPLDACEIGRAVARPGDVKQVKPLGILGLIDEGETDWKVLVIDVRDPLAEHLDDIDDVKKHLPGLLEATTDWFRVYMMPDGREPNEFAFGGEFKGRGYAENIVGECGEAWRRLVKGEVERGDVCLDNTTLKDTPGKLDPDTVHLPADEDLSPAPVEEDLDEWYYIDREALKDRETTVKDEEVSLGVGERPRADGEGPLESSDLKIVLDIRR